MNRKSLKAFTLVEVLIVIAILGLMVAMAMPGIQKARQKKAQLAAGTVTEETEILVPQHCGKNVYYFPYVSHKFRRALVMFLETHKNLEPVTSMSDVDGKGSNESQYGETTGHTVVFREKVSTIR